MSRPPDAPGNGTGAAATPTPAERDDAALELSRIRDRIDELDRRIVALLNERAALGRDGRAGEARSRAGGRSATRSASARCCCGSRWPTRGRSRQADLLSIYRRIVAATRSLEARDRHHDGRDGDG